MADVVQCDICGAVEAPQCTKFVKLVCDRKLMIFDVDASNLIDEHHVIKKDICSSCYAKLNEFLGVV